jgi:hypothetical protein
MAVAQGYGKTVTSGSVFAYDVADTRNSYRGQPTVNGVGTLNGYNPLDLYTWAPNGNTSTWARDTSVTSPLGGIPLKEISSGTDSYSDTYNGSTDNIIAASSGQTWTVSVYALAAAGTNIQVWIFEANSSGNYIEADYNGFTATGIWQRISVTRTFSNGSTAYVQSRVATSTNGGVIWWDGLQVEQKSYPTQFVNGTRSATQGLLPVVGNSIIDLSNVSFDSNAQMTFDGTNDLVDITTNFGTLNAYTFEYVAYANSGGNMPIASRTNTNFYKYGAYSWRYTHGGVGGEFYHNTGNETGWSHWVITYDGSTISVWENGISKGTASSSGTADFSGGIRIGSWASSAAYTWDGTIPVFRMYNRALTAAEVKQNFDFYDARFGIEIEATYYFVVSNRFSRSTWFDSGYNKIMADTTPAYIIYQKPDANFANVGTYTTVFEDPIGSPPKNTVLGVQYAYGDGRFLTTVNAYRSKKGNKLSFTFPDGRTSTYGEEFYKTIVTPYVP